MSDVEAALRDWAKLTGCWVIEAPRGSYARWLERTGLERVSPRLLRRFIEAMLTDPDLGERAKLFFRDLRALNGNGTAKATMRAAVRMRRVGERPRARELELLGDDDASRPSETAKP